ncbi:hypothetical protein DWU99_10605 [Dyella psychrodurans]|uniref:Uncharacterized protein n=1 Tax=Dyella psychrodurans TaxID=1927960 RepID=A0A370X6X0_9GAMM|nr:hypothetical protein DWU99_10605 [Dyella psychrodurans]
MAHWPLVRMLIDDDNFDDKDHLFEAPDSHPSIEIRLFNCVDDACISQCVASSGSFSSLSHFTQCRVPPWIQGLDPPCSFWIKVCARTNCKAHESRKIA